MYGLAHDEAGNIVLATMSAYLWIKTVHARSQLQLFIMSLDRIPRAPVIYHVDLARTFGFLAAPFSAPDPGPRLSALS
jgi:hypothetical protein